MLAGLEALTELTQFFFFHGLVLSPVLETISFTLANQIHPGWMDVTLTLLHEGLRWGGRWWTPPATAGGDRK